MGSSKLFSLYLQNPQFMPCLGLRLQFKVVHLASKDIERGKVREMRTCTAPTALNASKQTPLAQTSHENDNKEIGHQDKD